MKYYKTIIRYKANNLVQDYAAIETFDFDLAYDRYNAICDMSDASIIEAYLDNNTNIEIIEKVIKCIDGDSCEVC